MLKTAYLYDPLFLNHDTGAGHPECSRRLTAAHGLLSQQEWFGDLHQIRPQNKGEMMHENGAAPADTEWLKTVHSPEYIARVRRACVAGEGHVDTPDVPIGAASYEVARAVTGGVLAIADEVMAGRVDNGFACVRPPGHHAEADFAMGFCLFNSVAVAARYLQGKYELEKIMILDWDVHHGNGTQHIFEHDPSVFYMSLHQSPHYPGTGQLGETGMGNGAGATLNCPMNAGAGDAQYRQAFAEKILPMAKGFNPDAILLSAGFDAHYADPLGAINLENHSYIWMTQQIMELADQCCNGRIISVLEGGYDLNALAESVSEHVKVLSQS